MMKKSIFISAITLFMSFTTIAQTSKWPDKWDTREKFVFGAKAGINISNIWDEKSQDFQADSKIGFAGGVFVSIPIGKWIGIQPEILLSQKGLKGSGSIIGSPYSFSRTATYLAAPILFQVKPIKYMSILVGPQFSYLLNQKDIYSLGENSLQVENEFNNDNIRKNMLGFVAGIDVNISFIVIATRVGWDFRYNRGDGSSLTPRYKNQWIQFTVGVKI